MRIQSLKVANFQGIKSIEISDVGNLPLVTLSGRNGSGKSTIFLAASLAWDLPVDFNQSNIVGPWGEEAEVSITIRLTNEERALLYETLDVTDTPPCPEFITLGTVIPAFGEARFANDTVWAETLRSKKCRTLNPFSKISVIPAERTISRRDMSTLDPNTLSQESAEQIRTSAIDSMVNQWTTFSLDSIPDFLAALDYADLIDEREGNITDGHVSKFDEISDSFFRATGKRIKRPSYTRSGGFAMFVDAQNGNHHALSDLSSGEHEALGLMYMVRRLAMSGGILLVDEPELHLHPALQTTILEMIETGSDSSQLWLSTHSPNLINSAPVDSLISIASGGDEGNQATRIQDKTSRLELLNDLGVTPSAWLQHDRIIVVEGPTDKRYLELIFPVETARSLIYIAGNRDGVDATVRTLSAGEQLLPWLAIRDLDLINAGKMATGREGFTWSRRTFENIFLDGELISRTICNAAGSITAAETEAALSHLAASEKESVRALLVEEKVKSAVPGTRPPNPNDYESALRHQVELLNARIARIEDFETEVDDYIEDNWERDWKKLVQGKRVLSGFVSKTPFSGMANFMNAVCKTLRESPELMPLDLQEVQGLLIHSLES
ncbi:ATP-dependent nuclease [Streptomyces anulatus]|uniref:ATP-dependent nuclease n=1 Tax=Streptomyces anulatus TaxID=1892 RepID=UPI0016773BCC|nr:ATP-binding protein [Streptomyces anulatus]